MPLPTQNRQGTLRPLKPMQVTTHGQAEMRQLQDRDGRQQNGEKVQGQALRQVEVRRPR